MSASRSALLLTALLLGCATAESAKEDAVDAVPFAKVNEALARLREAGLELVKERDEALEDAEKYRKQLHECDEGRRT